jgi:hypothetical protein
MNKETFKVKPVQLDQTIKNIVDAIDKGYELQGFEELSTTEEQRLDYSDSLILKPDYQREYRATLEDESSLIESILVGIPIPPVFLCSSRLKDVQVLNVVDGQHRLFAFYRFRKGEFALTGLQLLDEYEGKCFSELPIEAREEIIGHKLPAYVFRDFPGKKFELEVFNRYNKGTKALTPQEIRNAVYASPYNDYVNSFVNKLFTNQSESLALVYNVTKDRFLKKKVHEGIFSILYVLEYGINKDFKDSITYATEYMKMKSEFTNENEEKTVNEDVNSMIERFKNFNEWLLKCTSITTYPLSKELYGISSKSYKFQTSMALILPALYRKIYLQGEKYSSFSFEKIMDSIQYALSNSFLEKADYSVSSTNSKEIFKLVENFKIIDSEVSEN